HLPPAEARGLRIKLLGKARSSFRFRDVSFGYTLLAHEGNWAKMLEFARQDKSPSFILPWFDDLYQYDAKTLLDTLLG
ncbi:hypothetical protein NL393_40035, partial [Klebsiella pneumoniae]|nr:hypothetical protein [Klebsiella pneumoniae]